MLIEKLRRRENAGQKNCLALLTPEIDCTLAFLTGEICKNKRVGKIRSCLHDKCSSYRTRRTVKSHRLHGTCVCHNHLCTHSLILSFNLGVLALNRCSNFFFLLATYFKVTPVSSTCSNRSYSQIPLRNFFGFFENTHSAVSTNGQLARSTAHTALSPTPIKGKVKNRIYEMGTTTDYRR